MVVVAAAKAVDWWWYGQGHGRVAAAATVLFYIYLESWDSVAIDTVDQIADPYSRADFAVVLMENGSVDIVLVGKRLTIVLFHKLDTSLHQLAPSAPGYDKASEDFITTVVEKFIDHFNCNAVHSAFIASPDSNLKNKFLHRLWSEASARQLSSITKYIKIFDVNSSTGQKMSLREVLESVMTYIDYTEPAKEIKALESFWTMLRKDRHSACFGPTHVEAAHNVKAVKTLLISNDVLRINFEPPVPNLASGSLT